VLDLRGLTQPPRPGPVALDPAVTAAVREIIGRVRHEGDAALFDLTRRFDGPSLSSAVASTEEFAAAREEIDPALWAAIEAMIDRLRSLHLRQLPQEWWDERDGVRFGEIVRPLRSVGCYVPGGRAAYPSTVAMTVVPAKVAGVERVIVASPPRADGSLPPAVLSACELAGADLVVKCGGAQAVAALAYGTESVPAVDKIVGPGNVYVTAAKREVYGDVGIDSLAGPTELVVVADASADPVLLDADLEAQAEHDPLARATVVTWDEPLARRIGGRAVLVSGEEQAADVVNDLAPEHLELLLPEPATFVDRVHNAGAVFVGSWSAVPFGDYGVGSNHVLPTMGTARWSSGLRAADFVTTSSVVEISAEAARRFGPEVAVIARSEGLPRHARAVELRGDAR
jgi:histidinol dehydrogenase